MSETKTETKIAPKKADTVKHKTMIQALLEFQKDMPTVTLDGKNPHFNSQFTTLKNLTSTLVPKLNAVGIATATTSRVLEDGTLIAVAKLIHESGEEMVAEFPIKETNPQKIGSAVTYFRRYGIAALSGVVADADDDGNAASEAPRLQPRAVQQVKTAAPSGQSDELKELTSKIRAWASGDEERRKKANETHTRLKENLSGVKLQQAIIKELGIE